MQQRHYTPIPSRRSATQSGLLAMRHVPQQQMDAEEGDYFEIPRMPTSARRYVDTGGNQVFEQGNRRIVIHEEPPPRKGGHGLLYLGTGMILMLALWVGLNWLGNWWAMHQLDASYGFPRTYQTDAVVGHNNDNALNPSHFIFLNLNGKVEIIELPAGDASKAKIYSGPAIVLDNAALVPVTGEFRSVDGKEEMIVHIENQEIIYVSNGKQFIPKP
jgi:hypothetical protein